jgi:hypothetical protein
MSKWHFLTITEPEKEEAEKAFADTEKFLDFIFKLLPDEVKP